MQGLAMWLALQRKFMHLVKDAEESMVAWISYVKSLAFGLEDVGVKVTDEDLILTLANGLDDSYNSFVITLDSMPVWVDFETCIGLINE